MILNKAALLKTFSPCTFTLTGSYAPNFIVIRSVDFEKLLQNFIYSVFFRDQNHLFFKTFPSKVSRM